VANQLGRFVLMCVVYTLRMFELKELEGICFDGFDMYLRELELMHYI
jgi:hypothetical protein